jgi:hypothetical protein
MYLRRKLVLVALVGFGLLALLIAAWTAGPHLATAFQQPSPTPGFGPIITSPPDFTPQPKTPVPTPTQPTEPPSGEAPAALPTATLGGTPLPTLDASMMGIQIHPDLSQEDFLQRLEQVKRLGVKWVKFQFGWDLLIPEPGVESELMGRYRLFVQSAYGQGLDVLVSIAKAPDWTRSTTEEDGPPTDPQQLAAILTRMLQHIDLDLYGFHPVDAIEVWNEPNLRREWNGGTLNGADYMRYFDAAYNAVRAAPGGANIVVVTAGLAPTGINDGVTAVEDRTYLRQMYQAGLGNPKYQNIAIGVHPYSAWHAPDAHWCGDSNGCSGKGWDNHPSFFFMDIIDNYHAIMQEFGDNTRQMWATEFGWGTYDGLYYSDGSPAQPPDGFGYYTYIDQVQMGNYILRAFEIGQSLPYMGVMFLWNLNFADPYYIDNRDPRAAYAVWGTQPQPERFAFTLIANAPKTNTGE